MRLLFLTSNYPRKYGDYAGIFVLDLAKILKRLGHEVMVVAPHYPGAKYVEKIDGIQVRRFLYAYPPSQQRLAYGRFTHISNPVVALQLLPYVLGMFVSALSIRKESQYDIIVAFWTFPQALAGVMLKWLFKKPLVIRAQSSDILSAGNISPLFVSFLSRLYCLSDRIIPNSNYTKNLLPNLSSLNKKITTVREGIDPRKFRLKKTDTTEPEIKILTVARLIERKGIRYLLYAMKEVMKITPSIKLYIVGEGPDREEFEKLAQNLILQEHVIFEGRVTDEELVSHYASSEIFILPSTEEALGVVLLEAMLQEIPVIASDVGGIPEIVIDNKTGILTKPGDPKDIANAVSFLVNNPEVRREYGRNGRNHVLNNFTWDKIARDFEKIFYHLLKNS